VNIEGLYIPPPARKPRRRLVQWTALALVLIAVALTASWCVAQSHKPIAEGIPQTARGYSRVCAGGRGAVYPDTPRYAGPGPNVTVVTFVFDDAQPFGINASEARVSPFDYPADIDVGSDQLAACLQRTDTTNAVGECPIQQTAGVLNIPVGQVETAVVYQASYMVTLRELRTGRVVATATMGAGDTSCPSTYSTDVFITHALYSWPTLAQWNKALAAYVYVARLP
jgi:hypothetical protein